MPRSREREPRPPGERDSNLDYLRCVWKSKERRCYLQGGMSPHIGEKIPYYCSWHYLCLTSSEFSDNYHEFERFLVMGDAYCSVENHYPPDEIWSAIQGIVPIRGMPHRCKACLCKHSTQLLTPSQEWLEANCVKVHGFWINKQLAPGWTLSRRREAVELTHDFSPTQISREEVERQKHAILGLDGQPAGEEVPF